MLTVYNKPYRETKKLGRRTKKCHRLGTTQHCNYELTAAAVTYFGPTVVSQGWGKTPTP